MTSDKLNKWLTLLANIAVVMGIIVLVIEVNQNTQGKQRLLSATSPLLNILNLQQFSNRWKLIRANFVPEFLVY